MPAHSSESHKDNLKHFEGLNPDNDTLYHKLDLDDLLGHENFVSRANTHYADARAKGLPDYFKAYMDEVKKVNRQNININYEAVYALRTAFGETIWDNDISALISVPSRTLANPRWQIKDYTLTSFEKPRFSRTFRSPAFLRMKESSQVNEGIGLYLGMSQSFTEIAESGGGLWQPSAVLQSQLGQVFGLQKSRRFFLGTDITSAYQDDGEDAADLGITGIYNASGIQTAQFGNGDENVTADGEIEFGLGTALTDLARVYVKHKKVLISTRGYAAEAMLYGHRDTYTGVTDFERVCQLYFDTGIISDWIVTDQLYKTAESTLPSTSQQQAMILCIADTCVQEDIIYPVQTLPLQNTLYPGDLAEVTIFANAIYYPKADTTNNAFPATTATGVITSTGTGGWIPQGRLDVGMWRSKLASKIA